MVYEFLLGPLFFLEFFKGCMLCLISCFCVLVDVILKGRKVSFLSMIFSMNFYFWVIRNSVTVFISRSISPRGSISPSRRHRLRSRRSRSRYAVVFNYLVGHLEIDASLPKCCLCFMPWHNKCFALMMLSLWVVSSLYDMSSVFAPGVTNLMMQPILGIICM